MDDAYWLIYRMPKQSHTRLEFAQPVGGLVAQTGMPTALLFNVCEQRYHCGPGEHLILLEVTTARDRCRVAHLHNQWEREMQEFLELMKNNGPQLG